VPSDGAVTVRGGYSARDAQELWGVAPGETASVEDVFALHDGRMTAESNSATPKAYASVRATLGLQVSLGPLCASAGPRPRHTSDVHTRAQDRTPGSTRVGHVASSRDRKVVRGSGRRWTPGRPFLVRDAPRGDPG
jgi:hypothetical protein